MAETPNPYIAGNPLTGTEMFFGRTDVFAFVRQALSGQHQDNVLVLYGQRRTGKTSVLYQMHRHLEDRYLCVFIDLHGLALDGLGGFIQELANYIARGLRKNYQINLPDIDKAEMAANPRYYFESTFLDNVWAATGEHHLLLMLDEAIRLAEQIIAGKMEAEVFNYLRHLMQHHPRLNFLFSLGSGLEEMEKEYAFLFNVALYKKISFLDRQSAVDLITRPVAGVYSLETEAIERILEVTSGHPYHTQLICHGLYNHAQARGLKVVAPQDVDAVLDEAVERGLAVLKHVWEESTDAEKAVLAGMAACFQVRSAPVSEAEVRDALVTQEIHIPKTILSGAIKTLIARDVISGESTYRFTVDLQRRWVQKYRRIEWVKGEIDPWLNQLPPEPAAAGEDQKNRLKSPPRRKRTLIGLSLIALAVVAGLLAVAYLAGSGWVANRQAAVEQPIVAGGNVILGGVWNEVNDLKTVGDEVWAATDGGLVRWLPDGASTFYKATDMEFPSGCINALDPTKDSTRVWLGCGGVARVSPSGKDLEFLASYNRDDGLGMGVVRDLLVVEDSTVWAGGKADPDGMPLSYFDGENWVTDIPPVAALSQYRDSLPSIRSIWVDADNRLWLGSDDIATGGVLLWDGESYQQFTYSDPQDDNNRRVRSIHTDRKGNVWIAAEYWGLLNLVLDSGQFFPVQLPDYVGPATVITELSDGSLWVGGDHYIATSSDFGITWSQVGTTEGLGVNINGIIQSTDGQIWVSSYGGGISILEGGDWKPVPLRQ